jgi:hypothetical protein
MYSRRVKVKVKLWLCLLKPYATKAYERLEVWRHAFLTSALDGSEWLASRLVFFTLGTH